MPVLLPGSSPRMWGTPSIREFCIPHARFIPTHVGNSRWGHRDLGLASVHPHACGELRCRGRRGRASGGSSPRMWGTPWSTRPGSPARRFIPTHVGNSLLLIIPGRMVPSIRVISLRKTLRYRRAYHYSHRNTISRFWCRPACADGASARAAAVLQRGRRHD